MYKYQNNYKLKEQFSKTLDLNVLPFFKRFKILKNNSESLKKVIIIKNHFDNSTFRYRGTNMFESMLLSKKYSLTYFKEDELPNIYLFLKEVSIVILQRVSWSFEIDNLISFCHKNNIPLVYDMDDLFYKSNHVLYYMNHTNNCENEELIHVLLGDAQSYKIVMEQCDYFIATTDALKNNLENDFKKNSFVIHNFYNSIQEQNALKAKSLRVFDESKFCVGYFSGSPSHQKDFEIIENNIYELLNTYPQLIFIIVGFMNFSKDVQQYISNGRIRVFDFVAFNDLPFLIAMADVNLIPLTNDEFNNAKSELKYFESAMLEVPSIVSNLSSYQKIIKEGINGLFANELEWCAKVGYLYNNRQEVLRIGKNAFEDAVTKYSFSTMTKIIEDVYDNILKLYRKS